MSLKVRTFEALVSYSSDIVVGLSLIPYLCSTKIR